MKLFTPFYGKYLEYGAKLVERLNWILPAVYTSEEEEYKMVRERAGVIDYSFQSGFAVAGRDAFIFLQKLIVNDLKRICPGKAIYSSILDNNGEIIDDTVVFWIEKDFFIINGGFRPNWKTLDWLKKNSKLFNVSLFETGTCFLALQGSKSREILQKAMSLNDLPYFGLKQDKIGDIPVLVARVSFSGELGFELYLQPWYAHELWNSIIGLGKDYDIGPYGMGVSTILANQNGYITIDYEGLTPLELGLEWTVAFDKEDFIGKDALIKRKNEGLKTKLMGFEVADPKVVAAKGDNLVKETKW